MHTPYVVADIRSDLPQEPIRGGFGTGLVEAAKQDARVVGVTADLTDSTKIGEFARAFPERFIQVGIGEQNLVTLGSGLAAMGKIPFVSAYAAFSPGRNWEQIRTTICLNEQPVKVIASHAGVGVGPDGATHQMLEDIALMRVLPNMVVIVPCDAVEAHKATLAVAADKRPAYVRLAREKSPVFTAPNVPFEIGKAYVLTEGTDITLCATGTMTYRALVAADILKKDGITAEVVHIPTIKPLDEHTIVQSVAKTRLVMTIEEAQIIGGLGGAIAELLGEQLPTPLKRLGMRDVFGESGEPEELYKHFGLTATHIALAAHEMIDRKQTGRK